MAEKEAVATAFKQGDNSRRNWKSGYANESNVQTVI